MVSTGFWNATWGENPSFHACPTPENCQAISNSNVSKTTPCLHNTAGPLCAVCLPRHTFDDGKCVPCTARNNTNQLLVLLAVLFCIGILVQVFRKRARKFYKKFGRDIIRILTINLGFAQINSTVPSVINIPWPETYIQYLKIWSFVNFDFTSILNLSCVRDGWDYRFQVALASCVPFVVVVFFVGIFLVMRCAAISRLRKGLSQRRLVNMSETIFETMDKDGSGAVDEGEFDQMLQLVQGGEKTKTKKKSKAPSIEKNNNTHERNSFQQISGGAPELTQVQLAAAFTDQQFDRTGIGKRMVRWAEFQRVRSSMLSGALIVLFLLHAPVSQRIFHYFVCHDIAGRSFLLVDYSLPCAGDKYMTFRLVPVLMLIIFTIGFPVVIFLLLFVNRKHLHTARVRSQLGFLYVSFRPNAGEFWEVHELTRKLLLMGALILVDNTRLRIVLALLVCLVSVASLHYFRPHQNRAVFSVAQASFLLTAVKYIVAISLLDATDENRRLMGSVLIFFDVCFVLGSVGSIVVVFYLLHSHVINTNDEEEKKAEKEKKAATTTKNSFLPAPTTKISPISPPTQTWSTLLAGDSSKAEDNEDHKTDLRNVGSTADDGSTAVNLSTAVNVENNDPR
jgi:hypothetical protein